MPYHRFTVINGRRVDLEHVEVKGEWSCDVCGRFIAKPVTVSLTVQRPEDGPVSVVENLCGPCYGRRFPQLALDYPADVQAT